MKTFTVLAFLLTAAAATNPFLSARGDPKCECDTSRCNIIPTSMTAKHCDCVNTLLDACYVAQTEAGADCGLPVYPDGCQGMASTTIADNTCTSKDSSKCSSTEMCYFADRSCDPRTETCNGLCANMYCGGTWNKSCPDNRWSCAYDDACERSGGLNCVGKCELN